MTGLHELNKEFALNVPSATPDGIDISLLTSVIRPIADLIETDMQWDYLGLQAEIGQNYREKYQEGALVDGKVSIVGAKASGHWEFGIVQNWYENENPFVKLLR